MHSTIVNFLIVDFHIAPPACRMVRDRVGHAAVRHLIGPTVTVYCKVNKPTPNGQQLGNLRVCGEDCWKWRTVCSPNLNSSEHAEHGATSSTNNGAEIKRHASCMTGNVTSQHETRAQQTQTILFIDRTPELHHQNSTVDFVF